MIKRMNKNQKGFTLVELIVVIAILGILATLLVPKIMGNVKDADKKTDISNARTIASEVTLHNATVTTGTGNTIPASLPAAGTTATLSASDISGTDLKLPASVTFPKDTNVTITVDSKGNAEINIVS
jgi:prepilin-type N-terminal cleavage/methylation domain-containing protein